MKCKLCIVLTLLFFLGFPGCHCPEFYLISGVEKILFYHPGHQTFVEQGEITTDTLRMQLVFHVESFTDSGVQGIGLMSSADAFQVDCANPLANSIQSLTFRSDQDFNDIPAGQSLNNKLRNTDYHVSIDSLPEIIAYAHIYGFSLNFQFEEKPAVPNHTFSVTMIDNAGNQIHFNALQVIWH